MAWLFRGDPGPDRRLKTIICLAAAALLLALTILRGIDLWSRRAAAITAGERRAMTVSTRPCG